jgi:hypothetical protein
MSKTLVKQILWLVIIGIVLGSTWLVLSGMANLLSYFQQGADPASALNIVPNVPPDLHVSLSWQPDDQDTGRKLEPNTRTQLEATYLRAWLQWNISYQKNEPYGLKTYFSGPALDAVGRSVSQVAEKGWKVQQADTIHRLQLHLYSADGSVVSFTDEQAVVAQTVRDQAGKIITAGESQARYDVVMLLEDGNWRVRTWQREARDNPAPEQAVRPQSQPGFVARKDTSLELDGKPYQIAGINYYPQATPWDKFWPGYKPAIIDKDLGLIASLELNTIRIFVPFEQFGGAKVDPKLLEKLDDLLDKAGQHHLKVIATLFDFRTDYSLLLWPNADRQLETLLTRYRDNPVILAWDLKNEPDLDYAVWGREVVNAWLAHVAHQAHAFDPNHLLTVGWSNPAAAGAVASQLDFVSFHYFAPANLLAAQYSNLRAQAPGLPLVMTEFGLPTWNSFLFPNGHSEPEQAEYYADIINTLSQLGSPGYLAWTLYDFDYVPKTVAGGLPWQNEPQKLLGIIKTDGNQKPAAAILKPGASVNIEHSPAWARFLKPFWLTVIAILGLGGVGIIRLRHRLKKHLPKPGLLKLPGRLSQILLKRRLLAPLQSFAKKRSGRLIAKLLAKIRPFWRLFRRRR